MGDDDDNDKNKSYESDSSTWDFGGEETQIFDSQISDSPTSSPGDKFNSTVPIDETAVFEDELTTQVIDPNEETQLFNLYDDTQVVNFDAKIEEMDIPDSAEEHETQLFNDFDTEEVVVSDHEGSDKTEIVEDSDDDCGRGEHADSADIEHTQILHHCEEDIKENYSKIDCGKSQQHTSGVGFKTFTSTRAASMRAAGLAALSKASETSKSPSNPNLSSEPDIEHRGILFEKSKSKTLENNNQIDESETGSRFRFGRSTARKLFADDEHDETEDVNDDFTPREANELAGLSYIDSQEPGDASQPNALDFVDNFLKVNIEVDNEFDFSKSTGGKSKPVLSAKGTQSFAKSVCLINAVDEVRIFDWDDNLEEDEGGDFFRKNKQAFFASGGRRVKSSISNAKGRKLGDSDSKLVLGINKEDKKTKKSLGSHIKDLTLRKNLTDEFGKQSTDMPAGVDIQEKIQETTDFRFDTQMAAEAMEELCFGLQSTDHDLTKSKGSHKSQKPPLVRKLRSNSKSKMSVDQSMEVKRARSATAKRKGKVSLKRREVDSPVDQIPVKKQCIQNVTPVTRRTRQSIKDNQVDKIKDASTSTSSDDTLFGFYPKRKRTCKKSPSLNLKQTGTKSTTRLTRSNTASLTLTRVDPKCTTPFTRGTPIKESSPVCKGDEYLKQSCRRSSLIQEVMSLSPTGTTIISPNKDSRKRKDVSLIRVLFSRHLDGDIIKHQKKILSRLGASESESMSDATHFIADDFVRTRNMLEAIAFGKPVVTHLWLESCAQTCCHIDEKNFILKDPKKEKEFGFSLPNSLACARQNPLLKGHKVLITPNTKPGKEILSSLVKAVHGVAIERMGRSGLKDDKIPEGLLILSCEEDYSVCLPFLEKGAAIYSSELLLNGIVTQRLEYERHRLFVDHVKRTRSTIWLKKDDKYTPVSKVK